MQPLSVVENKGFLELMKVAEPRFKVPSRGYFTKTVIPSLFSRVKQSVKEMLKTARFLCITADLWTAAHSNRAYLCLTCHGIDSDRQLCSFCLATKELPVAHTADNIGEKIEEMLDEWNIDKDSSYARNMINAINGMGFCHFPCMGHTLQLGILKAFDIGPVKAALARVSSIVSHFHRSSKATYSLKEKQNLLGLKPHMLKAHVLLGGGVHIRCLHGLQNNSKLCVLYFWRMVVTASLCQFAVIEELVDILKPFNDATKILSGDLYPTLGIVQPVFNRFLSEVLPSKPGDRDIVKKIKDAIRQNLSTRYQEEEIETMLLVAVYLDPRFKKAPMLTAEKKASMKSFMKYELEVYILNDQRLRQVKVSIVEQEPPSLTEPESRSKRTKLEKFFGDTFQNPSEEDPSEEVSAAEAAEAELQRYELEDPLSLDSKNPLLWWKEREVNYKFLSILAKRFLCITSTSVPSERLFSSAGNLLSERRSRLSPENVEKLLFPYENNKLLNTL